MKHLCLKCMTGSLFIWKDNYFCVYSVHTTSLLIWSVFNNITAIISFTSPRYAQDLKGSFSFWSRSTKQQSVYFLLLYDSCSSFGEYDNNHIIPLFLVNFRPLFLYLLVLYLSLAHYRLAPTHCNLSYLLSPFPSLIPVATLFLSRYIFPCWKSTLYFFCWILFAARHTRSEFSIWFLKMTTTNCTSANSCPRRQLALVRLQTLFCCYTGLGYSAGSSYDVWIINKM